MSPNDSFRTEVDEMECWLDCLISLGQFTGEYAVKIETGSGAVVSLFAPKADIDYEEPPRSGVFVNGLIRVKQIEEQKGVSLVCLPRQTLENGRYIAVKSTSLRQEA
jgi:hypothetical protein